MITQERLNVVISRNDYILLAEVPVAGIHGERCGFRLSIRTLGTHSHQCQLEYQGYMAHSKSGHRDSGGQQLL